MNIKLKSLINNNKIMKFVTILLFLTFLASCTTQNVETETKVMEDKTTQETIAVMDDALSSLDNMEKDESKVQLIKYSYANPAQEVNMDINYNLDASGKITMIDITSDNWDKLGGFNTAAKEVVVWLTLEQASEVELISGASLTTAAFKEAIKTQL